jgi:hypothetical protein
LRRLSARAAGRDESHRTESKPARRSAIRPGWQSFLGVTLVAPGLLIVTLGQHRGAGDEPSRYGFGRLFRFGGAASTPSPAPPPSATPTTPALSSPLPTASTGPSPEVSPPAIPDSPATPRLVPRPRVSRPVTESDPIITRITLNRSDDGNQFGMFLQIFADGTIIDSEGVHHLGQEALKPIVAAIQSGELYRLKGHCGAPATDSLESVHVIVYERSLGRLRANSFSYSGNPQGCDHGVRHLHATLDSLQARITRPLARPAGPAAGIATTPPTPAVPAPSEGQTVIPLTAPD